mmetsp:Transcript_4554/g.16322  ORF Transcript_4554/g.16322 Transcript_4554/m.16322 type:complete len:781 (-) Transcript_4554:159-2501(-)
MDRQLSTKTATTQLTSISRPPSGLQTIESGSPLSSKSLPRTWKKVVPKVGSFAVLQDPRPEPHPDRAFTRDAKRVIIKVGTGVVTRSRDGRLSLGRLGALVEQMEVLKSQGLEVILVTSGSVGIGRQRLRYQHLLHTTVSQRATNHALGVIPPQAAAAMGQGGLMALYDTLFGQMDMCCAQLLVTDEDFKNDDFRTALRQTVEDLISVGVVPVFNENDAVSTRTTPLEDNENRIFWDNDSLAGLLALQLEADVTVLLSDVDGLYTGPPDAPDSKLVHTFSAGMTDNITFGSKSRVGRGGMTAKVKAAWTAAQAGCPVIIASGKKQDSLLRAIVNGEQIGTLFHPQLSRREPPDNMFIDLRGIAKQTRESARALNALSSEVRRECLHDIADALIAQKDVILLENRMDVEEANRNGTAKELLNRLKLDERKLERLAEGIRTIANMDEPLGQLLSRLEVAEGLELQQVTSPLGVLLIIFESRPDALPQIAALAIRSGNGLLLKGGKEAFRSNHKLHSVIQGVLKKYVPDGLIALIEGRETVDALLAMHDDIDLVIPRGSNALVSSIQSRTKIPVLGHADGVCHMYIDAYSNEDMAIRCVVDAKADYPAACNAVETVLVHEQLVSDGRAQRLLTALRAEGITVCGGPRAAGELKIPVTIDLHKEYGDMTVTLEIVENIDAAIAHIHAHGSSHTDSIITSDEELAKKFLAEVDSACVFHNASTRFADGFRFGLGAEVGISTSRIHARGPVGVKGLLTTRWLLKGQGHIVSKDTDIEYTHKPLPLR